MKLQELITKARRDQRRVKLRENQQRYYERNWERIQEKRREGIIKQFSISEKQEPVFVISEAKYLDTKDL